MSIDERKLSQVKKFFELLFDDADKVVIGKTLFDLSFVSRPSFVGPEFFAVNSVHGKIDYGYQKKEEYDEYTPRRADINVSEFRNFMFEMDNLQLADQLIILENCGIPWTAITFSGSKSFHAILSLSEPLHGAHTQDGIDNYKQIWRQLEAQIVRTARKYGYQGQIVDPTSKNPSRFTRYPESERLVKGVISGGAKVRQTLTYTGQRISEDNFIALLEKCPNVKTADKQVLFNGDSSTIDEFWKNCPGALSHKIRYVNWAESAGMYPELYKLTLWAIDSTNVDKEVWVSALEKYVFPALKKAGYPESKFSVGIDHAYREKK